ncbi:hypothetical protein EMIT0P260_160040 [Pseudomonas sp. IT-P260]
MVFWGKMDFSLVFDIRLINPLLDFHYQPKIGAGECNVAVCGTVGCFAVARGLPDHP